MNTRLKFALFALGATLAVVLVLTMAYGGWLYLSGQRNLAATQAELAAKGESLSLDTFKPPAIREEENFFNDPMWREYADLVKHPGAISREPRIPKEKMEFARLLPPVSPQESEALSLAFPVVKQSKGETKRTTVANQAWLHRDKTPSGDLETANFLKELWKPCEPLYQRLSAMSKRPDGFFFTTYDEGAFSPVPHLAPMIYIAQYLGSRANYEICLSQPQEVLHTTTILTKLQAALRHDPIMISHLVRCAIAGIIVKDLQLGLERSIWNDEHLAVLETELSRIDLMDRLTFVLRAERAASVPAYDVMERGKGIDWYLSKENPMLADESPLVVGLKRRLYFLTIRQEQARYYQIMQEWMETADRAAAEGVPTSAFPTYKAEMEAEFLGGLKYLGTIASIKTMQEAIEKTMATQNKIAMARLACGLERYRLAEGKLPDALSDLLPRYLKVLPLDVLTAQPMMYQGVSDSEYSLYSIGRDLADDHGSSEKDRDAVWTAN